MPRPTTSNGRPRAIAVPFGTRASRPVLGLGLVTLLLLVLAAGAARAQERRATPAVVDELWHVPLDLRSQPHGDPVSTVATRDDEPQSFARTSDRARRAAGRAGVPVRRDGRVGSAMLTTGAVLDRLTIGGPAPFGTPAANTPPSRGTTVHGVRGPPFLLASAA
jgi:hypothetical protein